MQHASPTHTTIAKNANLIILDVSSDSFCCRGGGGGGNGDDGGGGGGFG